MSGNEAGVPWVDGNYQGEGFFSPMLVTGDKGVCRDIAFSLTHGDFGPADLKVAEISEEQTYTVKISWEGQGPYKGKERVMHAVLTEDGRKFYFRGSNKTTPVGFLEWITQEEADLRAIDGDPIAAPPSHYKLEPERQGKLVWITGAPGLGKSTTAQLLARHHGFVFYEGDCFFGLRNPYIPTDVPEPSLAQSQQRKLVGEGAQERQEMQNRVTKEYMKRFVVHTIAFVVFTTLHFKDCWRRLG
jgi:hypothetical protein